MTRALPNAIEVSTYIPTEMTTYLSHLAQLPGIVSTRMKSEVVLRILLEFLRQKPWTTEGWEGFERSKAHHVVVDGVRHKSPDWVQYNVSIYDIAVGNQIVTSREIHASLVSAASTCVEARSAIDKGVTSFLYSALKWGTTVLFDPTKFAPKPVVSPFANVPAPVLNSVPARRMRVR